MRISQPTLTTSSTRGRLESYCSYPPVPFCLPCSRKTVNTTIYAMSHLFSLGDLNCRLDVRPAHPLHSNSNFMLQLCELLNTEHGREELKEFDRLSIERRKGTIFPGFWEAEFWKFKCMYKFNIGQVDQYRYLFYFEAMTDSERTLFCQTVKKRVPSWTDRILYATHDDSTGRSWITHPPPLLYTSFPSYTTSVHKPIVALLVLPPPSKDLRTPSAPSVASTTTSLLSHPPQYSPDPYAAWKQYTGKILCRILGFFWCIFVMLGLGNAAFGFANTLLSIGAMTW